MKPKTKLFIFYLNDWQGFYVDNELVEENHSLDVYATLNYIKSMPSPFALECYYCEDSEEDWDKPFNFYREFGSRLPQNLEQIEAWIEKRENEKPKHLDDNG